MYVRIYYSGGFQYGQAYDYLLPIFTFGKYYEDGGKYYIPLSIQVHHAVCDGFHVCRFLDELQDLLNK